MCLYIKSGPSPKKATEDITCYKVIIEEGYGEKRMMTPYTGCRIGEKIISGEKPFKAEIFDEVYDERSIEVKEFQELGYHRAVIGCGAIHTFETEEAAKAEAIQTADLFKHYKIGVYKCIIPKGTLYYEGVFADNDCFASQKIIFKESIFNKIIEK